MGFAGGSVVKNSPANAGDVGDMGLIRCWEDSSEEEGTALSSFLAWGILPGERSPVGYSAWGCRELYRLSARASTLGKALVSFLIIHVRIFTISDSFILWFSNTIKILKIYY